MSVAAEQLAPQSLAMGRLTRRVADAERLALRLGLRAFASVTVPIGPEVDPSATILAARGPGERFFCLEQPGRDGYAVCGVGEAIAVTRAGIDRFEGVAADCRRVGARTLEDDQATDPGRPPGAGPVFMGGFAFADAGGATPEWSGFEPAQMVLPELSIARKGDQARLTVTVGVDPREGAATEALEHARRRVRDLEPATMPLLDPSPTSRPRVSGAAAPSHYEDAVRRAVDRIRAGQMDKVVLAREVRVQTGREIDPAPVLDALRGGFPDCYCYCVGGPGGTFVGASPELLVRRDGARAQTVALAGTTNRSADPAVDDHLGEQLRQSPKNRDEQAIVERRIQRTLDPVSLWVAAADEPVLIKVLNVQHLATPIRAQLSDPLPAVELAGRLHPTPAVGGEPREVAEPMIPALEGLDRGWYAGAVGWTDLAEDGEFCVALRCALLRGDVAHLYAGCGIVADSVPADELAETEFKLQALLPLLA
ncbi:MAG TPA: isochorismate synthase [Thermoleophilaceae bacterium]|nr:isochorismate synthase [Thermoleophilaceae bacterium]